MSVYMCRIELLGRTKETKVSCVDDGTRVRLSREVIERREAATNVCNA